jgi:hypothetical protein
MYIFVYFGYFVFFSVRLEDELCIQTFILSFHFKENFRIPIFSIGEMCWSVYIYGTYNLGRTNFVIRSKTQNESKTSQLTINHDW